MSTPPVLHVIAAARRGGAEHLLLLVAAELVRRGTPVSIVFFEDGPFRADFERQGITCYALETPRRFAPGAVRRLRALIGLAGATVVHVHGLRALFHAGAAARLEGVPVAVTFHSVSASADADYGWLGLGYRMTDGAMTRLFADAAVATSATMQADLVAGRRVPASLLRVIPPVIDVERFAPVTRDRRLAARRRLEVSGPTIGLIGRLIPLKGHATMLDALDLLNRRVPEATLLVAGDGPARAELVRQARATGAGDRVRFLGELTDTSDVCYASDVVVYPSLAGIIGLAALEAMACGVPVVASALPGADEFIAPEETGRLVAPGQPGTLADVLESMLASPDTAARLGSAAATAVRARHSPEAAAARHEELYQSLRSGAAGQTVERRA